MGFIEHERDFILRWLGAILIFGAGILINHDILLSGSVVKGSLSSTEKSDTIQITYKIGDKEYKKKIPFPGKTQKKEIWLQYNYSDPQQIFTEIDLSKGQIIWRLFGIFLFIVGALYVWFVIIEEYNQMTS